MKKLKIWLEATHLFMSPTRHQSGIGYYTENIIRSLIELDQNDDFSVVANLFATNKPSKVKISPAAKNYNYKFIRFLPGKVWNQLIKRRVLPPVNVLLKDTPDVMVNFDFVRLPVSKKVKTLTVIHDLAFLHYPEFVQSRNLARLKKFVPLAIKKSDRIVAVSEHTKSDIVKSYKVDPQKIDVVSNAVNHKVFFPQQLKNNVQKKYSLPDSYILFIGNIEPRKNILGIIEAFGKLPAQLQAVHPLVLVGGKGWNDEGIVTALNNSSAKEHIVRVGYVDDDDLAQVYAGAQIFVFPSFYEGFGLPVLEAMASGTPVITSKVSSLPEVGGDAVLYVDPKKSNTIAEAMKKLLLNRELQQTLIKKGIVHSKQFSWEQSAGQMLHAIRKTME